MDSPKHQAMQQATGLLKTARTAALSVVDIDNGKPFVTLVNVAVDTSMNPLILISDLAHHAKCLRADGWAALLLSEPVGEDDPMLTFRMTLQGRFAPVDHDAAFLRHHPYAEVYAGFGDFHMWRMDADHTHIVAGFGRAYGVRFKDLPNG